MKLEQIAGLMSLREHHANRALFYSNHAQRIVKRDGDNNNDKKLNGLKRLNLFHAKQVLFLTSIIGDDNATNI